MVDFLCTVADILWHVPGKVPDSFWLDHSGSEAFICQALPLMCLPIHHVISLHATRSTRLSPPHLHNGSNQMLEVEKAWEQGC